MRSPPREPELKPERPDTERSEPAPSRATHLLLTGVIAVAFIGFVVGTVGSGRQREPLLPPRSAPPAPSAVPPAVTYDQMREVDLSPNREWGSRLDTLPRPEPDLFNIPLPEREVKQASLQQRETRRAYHGAPPVIPHSVDQMSSANCLACHENALRVGTRTAGRMPHPRLASCTQCHVEQQAPALAPFELAGNSFRGQPAPFEGPRAGPGAPPVIPHSTLMRTECLSCHGPLGPSGLRTTHPDRRSCLQCHAPSAELDQYAAGEEVDLLPGPLIRSP